MGLQRGPGAGWKEEGTALGPGKGRLYVTPGAPLFRPRGPTFVFKGPSA